MSTPICIIPAKFVQSHSRAARVWSVVRSIDHPDNHGTGCGKIKIHIGDLAAILNRSIRSAYRYIKAGLSSKFLHSCHNSNGELTIHYASLTRIAKQLELDGIGAIAQFNLEEIDHVSTRISEAAAMHLQRGSVWQAKRKNKSQAKQIKYPDQLLDNCLTSDRLPGWGVIQRGGRMLYLSEDWIPVGVSEKAIGAYVGCSERTIQRRFANRWRQERGLEPLNKAQAAVLIAADMSPQERKFYIECAPVEIRSRLLSYGRGVYLCGTNLYSTDTIVRAQHWRQEEYRQTIREAYFSKNSAKQGANAVLSISISYDKEPEPPGLSPQKATL